MHFVASDFDGTLMINNIVSAEDVDKIKEFREQGNIFTICTGRPVNSVLNELLKHGIPFDYIIGVNGAIAVDAKMALLYSHEIPYLAVDKILNILKAHEVIECHLSEGMENVIVQGNEIIDNIEIDKTKLRGIYVDAGSAEKALKLSKELSDELNQLGVAAYPNFRFVAIGISGKHKGNGVDQLVKHLNWNGSVSVIGDDYNDIPMFKRFNSFGIKSGIGEAIVFAKQQVNTVKEALDNVMKENNHK